MDRATEAEKGGDEEHSGWKKRSVCESLWGACSRCVSMATGVVGWTDEEGVG